MNTWKTMVNTYIPEASPFLSSPQLAMFILQFALYLLWPLVFFRLKRMGSAVYVAVAMWLVSSRLLCSFFIESSWLDLVLVTFQNKT